MSISPTVPTEDIPTPKRRRIEHEPSKVVSSPHRKQRQTRATQLGTMLPRRIFGAPPEQSRPSLEEMYRLFLIPLRYRDQIRGFEDHATCHLPRRQLEEARAYISSIISNKELKHEDKMAELALIRYYVERDSSFRKPIKLLVESRIAELSACFNRLYQQKQSLLPTGIPYTLHMVLTRIFVLPSGRCNLMAGSHAVKKIANHPEIVKLIGWEYHIRLQSLIEDIQCNRGEKRSDSGEVLTPGLRTIIERASKTAIHPNMQPLAREALCLGQDVALYPHYTSWLILTALMGKTRQRTSPDCAIQAIHRAAVAELPNKVADKMCSWFETGEFVIRGHKIPIAHTLMIPPLNLEISTIDQLPIASLHHPVVHHVANVASSCLKLKPASPSLSGHLKRSCEETEIQRFERALSSQYENLLIHLHMAYLRLTGNNDTSPTTRKISNSFTPFFFELEHLTFHQFAHAPDLAETFLSKLEEKLWLFDTKYAVAEDLQNPNILTFHPRHGEFYGIKTSSIENKKGYAAWLENSRLFFELQNGKWKALPLPTDLQAAILRAYKEAAIEVFNKLPPTQKQCFQTAANAVMQKIKSQFKRFLMNYISKNLEKETPLSPNTCHMLAHFKQGGYHTNPLMLLSYGSHSCTTPKPKNPKETLLLMTAAVHTAFRTDKVLIAVIQEHTCTLPTALCSIDTMNIEKWVEKRMLGPAARLLEREVFPEVLKVAERAFPAANIEQWKTEQQKITNRMLRDRILPIYQFSPQAQSRINAILYRLPTQAVLQSPGTPSMIRASGNSRFPPTCTAFGFAEEMLRINPSGTEAHYNPPETAAHVSSHFDHPETPIILDDNSLTPRHDRPRHTYIAVVANLNHPGALCMMTIEGGHLTETLPFDQFRCLTYHSFKK